MKFTEEELREIIARPVDIRMDGEQIRDMARAFLATKEDLHAASEAANAMMRDRSLPPSPLLAAEVREAFEAWAKQIGYNVAHQEAGPVWYYADESVRHAWLAWQAATQAPPGTHSAISPAVLTPAERERIDYIEKWYRDEHRLTGTKELLAIIRRAFPQEPK